MNYKILKTTRISISLLFLLSITFIFVDFRDWVSEEFTGAALYLQFVPSILKFINIFTIASLGFVFILAMTFLFGRVYCSTICPLGILQDVTGWIANRFKKKKKQKAHFAPAQNKIRYPILILTVVIFIFGNIMLVSWLDPYSNFGRISSYFFKPVLVGINNGLSSILSNFDIYSVYPVHIPPVNWKMYIIPGIVLGLATGFSIWRGRLYCNTVCPVGALLGFLSKYSLFKVKFDAGKCINCGKCEKACKAECIDFTKQEVDFSRCVACMNCMPQCPTDAINYQLSTRKSRSPELETAAPGIESTDEGKRLFLKGATAYLLGTVGISLAARAEEKTDLVPIHRENPVSPPGSISLDNFTSHCTACSLCVSACPTDVLQPTFLDYGFYGMMQPKMDYWTGFCNFDCTKCSEVCPTGAIQPIKLEEKQLTQLGIAKFVKRNCIVYTDRTDCGACSEHCPTKAVDMVPYEDGLVIPAVEDDICIGCGACEYACPVTPYKAIYVESNEVHQQAEKPRQEEIKQQDQTEEFPF
jgi:ferredoxin-type protein NapF